MRKKTLDISEEMSEQCVPCDRDCQECRETHVFATNAVEVRIHRDGLRVEK